MPKGGGRKRTVTAGGLDRLTGPCATDTKLECLPQNGSAVPIPITEPANLGFGAIIEALFVTLFHTPVNADDNVYVDTWRWLRFL